MTQTAAASAAQKGRRGGEHKGKQFSSPSPQKMGGKKKMGGGEAESSAESSSSFITSVEGWGRTIGITPSYPLNVLTISGTMAATGHKGREREAQQHNGRHGRDCLSPEGWMDGCFERGIFHAGRNDSVSNWGLGCRS